MAKKKKEILIPRISRTVWKKLCPDESEAEWEYDQMPGHYTDYIGSCIYDEENRIAPKQKIKVVALTNEYLNWLDLQGIQDSDRSRQKYMEQIDDKKAEQLLQRSKMNTNRYLMALPLIIKFLPGFNAMLQSEYRLPEELCVKLETKIAELYPDSKIIVPGTICKSADITVVDPDNWFRLVFDDKEHHPDWLDSVQDYESPFLPLAILYVPFIIEHTCRKAVFTYDELDSSDEFCLSAYDISETEGYEQVIDEMTDLLNGSGIFEDAGITVIEDIPPHHDAYTHERFWLHRIYEEFVDSMEEMMKEEMGDLIPDHPAGKFRA